MLHYKLDEIRLKAAVLRCGFDNLSHFAERFQLNRATIHHYMVGRGPLSAPYYQLCKALNCDPLSLLVPLTTQEKIDQLDEIRPLIKNLIGLHPKLAVGLLGSRASGHAKKYSDWDLGITGGMAPIDGSEFLRLKSWVDDWAEDLPRFVDLINLDQAPQWFLQEIHYSPIFLGGDQSTWYYFLGRLHGTKKSA